MSQGKPELSFTIVGLTWARPTLGSRGIYRVKPGVLVSQCKFSCVYRPTDNVSST